MSSSQHVSDEILNAWIDHELDDIEMMRVQVLLSRNPGLERRLHLLQQVKILVHAAKPGNASTLPHGKTVTKKSCHCQVAVASVALIFAGLMSWAFLAYNEHVPVSVELAQSPEQITTKDFFDYALKHSSVKVVLHIKHSDGQAGKKLFEQIDRLLATAERRQIAVRIEVLANGDGLNLLRQDISPYAQKIHDIQNRYDNVIFIACGDTIKRRKLTLAELKLFPEVMVTTSVNQQINLRQTQGWNVIHV